MPGGQHETTRKDNLDLQSFDLFLFIRRNEDKVLLLPDFLGVRIQVLQRQWPEFCMFSEGIVGTDKGEHLSQ